MEPCYVAPVLNGERSVCFCSFSCEGLKERMLLVLSVGWLEDAPSSVNTTLVHLTRSLLLHSGGGGSGGGGEFLFIRWVSIYWTLVMAICTVVNKAVTCGQLVGMLSLATFLEEMFRNFLYPSRHFH